MQKRITVHQAAKGDCDLPEKNCSEIGKMLKFESSLSTRRDRSKTQRDTKLHSRGQWIT